MDAPFLSVDGEDLAFSALEDASHDLDDIAFADGNRSDIVLSFQFLGQVRAHDLSSQMGRSSEMGLSGLSSLAGHT